jgi:hypothetical protein
MTKEYETGEKESDKLYNKLEKFGQKGEELKNKYSDEAMKMQGKSWQKWCNWLSSKGIKLTDNGISPSEVGVRLALKELEGK